MRFFTERQVVLGRYQYVLDYQSQKESVHTRLRFIRKQLAACQRRERWGKSFATVGCSGGGILKKATRQSLASEQSSKTHC